MRRMFGFLIGVVVGGLVGATITMLLAPKSGAELRQHLRERGASFIAEIQQAANARRIELQEHLESLRAPRIS